MKRLLRWLWLPLLLVFPSSGWMSWDGGNGLATSADPIATQEHSCGQESYLWSVIGNSDRNHPEERDAGVCARVIRLSWREYFPEEGIIDGSYVDRIRTQIENAHARGFGIILETGFHDTPDWVHRNYQHTRYINQYGEAYSGKGTIDSGDINLVFNPVMRSLVTDYLERLFADVGTDFLAVRLGGGRYGELTYPPAVFDGRTNSYWAYDANARAANPAPSWRPGMPSPGGEAGAFLTWYLGALVDLQNWQIATLRRWYGGPIMMLYPSWGIRPGQIAEAVAGNLDGSTSAEKNGEVQRGFDFARQVMAITDPRVIVTTTWLDADPDGDPTDDTATWSPVKYLAMLARRHPMKLATFGENTGQGNAARMRLAVAQMRRYGLIGMAWFSEEELFSGRYATLDDYRTLIACTPARRSQETDAELPC